MTAKKFSFFIIILLFSQFLFAQAAIPENYVSILDQAKLMNAEFYYDPFSKACSLEKNGNIISFRVGDEIMVMNYSVFKIIEKPVFNAGIIYVPANLMQEAQILFAQNNSDRTFKVSTILIDPGHGGKDPGTIGSIVKNGKKQNIYEKDIVLDVAKDLNAMLKAKYPDKKILMTRSTDVFLTLDQRVEIANSVKLEENEAIIYISIHANSAFNKTASGYEVWYLSPGYRRNILKEKDADAELLPILNSMLEEEYTTESILIAKFIHDGMALQIGKMSKSRGIKAEEWFVCRNANMPSVLVEVGFVSNEKEAELLADKDYLHKLTLGIYNGICSFVMHFEQSKGFTGL
ncbi:MAG: N-acetylmuramoyl-L-alanine amidase [Treponemataceae bacterium]|nr:N-acetylmuramoyl-L-alanine amidase [Treponemataceae bacterium]